MDFVFTIPSLIEILNIQNVIGTTTLNITGIASLKQAQSGDLSFLSNKKYTSDVMQSQATAILIPEDYIGEPQPNQIYLKVKNPSATLGVFCDFLAKKLFPESHPGIHPSAIIDSTAKIHPTATIGPLCVIQADAIIDANSTLVSQVYVGKKVKIGANTHIMPHVTLSDYVILGERVRIHSGTVIGSDGFGYTTIEGKHIKEAQIGTVEIQDDVEIGSNTSIDRARFAKTIIGKGTKIDNLVQIAHNVEIGEHSIIVAQAGIAGSTTLGHHVILGGQVGLVGHIHIGDGSMVGGQSGVNHDLPPKSYVRSSPALPIQTAMRIEILQRRLPELFKRVSTLEQLSSPQLPCEPPQA